MRIDSVVKCGGALLAHPTHLDAALRMIANAAEAERLVVVPGGGPFADAVRDADARLRLSDDTAHWMAILAMDQHAYLIADRLTGALVVDGRDAIAAALDTGRVPVLAPFRWLRAADQLPHSWDVTGDSIAAWIAGELGAKRLILMKPPGSEGRVVDAWFERALPRGVVVEITADYGVDERAHFR